MKIGIAGFGNMGSAIAARFIETGAEVTVWNQDGARVTAAGLPLAASPAQLAAGCDAIVSSLFDDHAVQAVYTGRDGLLAGGRGKLFIEMSTVAPHTQKALASEAAGAGARFIECPVSGTAGPARRGKLVGFAGGRAEDVALARPVLAALCRRVEHLGPIGAGAKTKLAVNLPLLTFWQAFGEAMALLRPLGKDPQWLVELFGDTAGAPAVLKLKADEIAAALAGAPLAPPTFRLDAMRKDLLLLLAEAQARHLSMPVAGAALSAFDAAVAAGFGTRDCAWMPAWWANRSADDDGAADDPNNPGAPDDRDNPAGRAQSN
jgi:3-hydroxyisobutyrate dehydrogenase